MKKALIYLLALTLLTGCAARPGSSTGSQTQLAPPPAMVSSGEKLSYTVETETVSDSIVADNGTVLYSYDYELPRLTARTRDGQTVEDTVTQAFNQEFDVWRSGEAHEETLQTAQKEYDWRMHEEMLEEYPWTEYAEALSHSAYQTDRLVSVTSMFYFYSGGAHPNTSYSAWNFDLEEGRFVPVDLLASDGDAFVAAVAAEILDQMEARAKEYDVPIGDLFFSDYTDIVAQWTNYAVSFDEAGMVVTFSPYDLAPYAAGEQLFSISYDFLRPFLSEFGEEMLQVSVTN